MIPIVKKVVKVPIVKKVVRRVGHCLYYYWLAAWHISKRQVAPTAIGWLHASVHGAHKAGASA